MYFSVKKTMKIAGRKYLPCICYPLTKALVSTLDKLVKDGTARTHENMVRFQSGKVITKSVAKTVNNAISVSSENDVTTEEATLTKTKTSKEKTSKDEKRSKTVKSETTETVEQVDKTKTEVGEDF